MSAWLTSRCLPETATTPRLLMPRMWPRYGGESDSGLTHHLRHHWDEALGMSARHVLALMREDAPVAPEGDGAGIERRIESQDQHRESGAPGLPHDGGMVEGARTKSALVTS